MHLSTENIVGGVPETVGVSGTYLVPDVGINPKLQTSPEPGGERRGVTSGWEMCLSFQTEATYIN